MIKKIISPCKSELIFPRKSRGVIHFTTRYPPFPLVPPLGLCLPVTKSYLIRAYICEAECNSSRMSIDLVDYYFRIVLDCIGVALRPAFPLSIDLIDYPPVITLESF